MAPGHTHMIRPKGREVKTAFQAQIWLNSWLIKVDDGLTFGGRFATFGQHFA